MKDLAKIRAKWLDNYFKETADIWQSWKKGSISFRERDETLNWYRRKLHELTRGKLPPPVYQAKPKRDDEWLDDL